MLLNNKKRNKCKIPHGNENRAKINFVRNFLNFLLRKQKKLIFDSIFTRINWNVTFSKVTGFESMRKKLSQLFLHFTKLLCIHIRYFTPGTVFILKKKKLQKETTVYFAFDILSYITSYIFQYYIFQKNLQKES